MTRPLKNQKVRWLYRHFWSLEVDYIWRDHSERGVTYPLTHSQVTTLRPEYWVEDDVLNAYGDLLRLREDKLWEKWEKIPRTESFKPRRYFIAPSFFMAIALEHCPNLKASPSTLKGDAKKSMEKFFRDYANKGGSLPLQFCDFAFFPTCDNSHWFLFVVNLSKMRVLNIDPLGDDKDTIGNIAHPCQYYIMEKLIPYMLNYLHPSRFPLKYMGVHGLDARPKQDGGNDYGVYVSKYMDAMLNGVSLPSAVWNAKVDVQTFRYRMAHELSKGVARHISEWGIRQREVGH
ncbi:putative ubiquitin-like-specific protease 1B [Apium graveolens]|uniref:putative ubiquitin-like-specific protease 1B n=1 Tax=Apium graveolens TaxID=4045 RepID=UPI003D7BA042